MGANESADIGRWLHAALRCVSDYLQPIARPQADGDPIARCDVVPFQIRLAGAPLLVAIEQEADSSQGERGFRESDVAGDEAEARFLLGGRPHGDRRARSLRVAIRSLVPLQDSMVHVCSLFSQ